jgi:tetratricopeptide (TPR) repeat protein
MCFDAAIKLDSKYKWAWYGKGNALYEMGNYTDAIKCYDADIKLDPKDEYAWYNKAMALRMLHRDSEAKAAYAKARELGYNGPMTLMEMTA